jgi:hypothetical protein
MDNVTVVIATVYSGGASESGSCVVSEHTDLEEAKVTARDEALERFAETHGDLEPQHRIILGCLTFPEPEVKTTVFDAVLPQQTPDSEPVTVQLS